MPLTDLEKLTVVKLRAELTARGLDSRGNKPFLIERLRAAIEQDVLQGVTHPAMKFDSSTDDPTGDCSVDQEAADMEDEMVTESNANSSLNSNAMSESLNAKAGLNGTNQGKTLFQLNFLSDMSTCSFLILKLDTINNESVTSPHGSPAVPCSESLAPASTVLPAAACEDESLPVSEASYSTSAPSAADDSIVAVYGGKDETFMETSTLDQTSEIDKTVNDIEETSEASVEKAPLSPPTVEQSAGTEEAPSAAIDEAEEAPSAAIDEAAEEAPSTAIDKAAAAEETKPVEENSDDKPTEASDPPNGVTETHDNPDTENVSDAVDCPKNPVAESQSSGETMDARETEAVQEENKESDAAGSERGEKRPRER